MHQITKFISSTNGNFAVTFSVMLVPLLLVGGLSVDMTRAYMYRSDLQNAVDAATLAAAIHGDNTSPNTERTEVGSNFFESDFTEIPATIKFEYPGDAVVGLGEYELPIMFGKLFGKETVKVSVEAVVKIPNAEKLDLVMALDYSGSMNRNGKYQAMRDAAIDLLDELDKSNTDGNIRAGLVPFSEYVLTDINSSHIRVVHPDKYNQTAQACIGSRFAPFAINGSVPAENDENSKWPTVGLNDYWKQAGGSGAGGSGAGGESSDAICLVEIKGGVENKRKCEVCTINASFADPDDRDEWGHLDLNQRFFYDDKDNKAASEKDAHKAFMKHFTDDCDKLKDEEAASRRDASDADNEKLVSDYPVDDPQCEAYVDNNLLATPLSADFAAMKAQLQIARPVQLTNIALSLDAAWYQMKNTVIDPNAKRFMVLLTDGAQTVPGYREAGRSNNSKYTINDAEKNTEDLCENIKADDIEMITIAFQLNSQPTRNRLRNCASSPSYFFEADSNSDLATVFQQIAALTKQEVFISR